MAYKDLHHFIRALEDAGELTRIKAYVDPKLEIAEVTDRVSKSGGGGKALLFENTGYDFPLLINALGSYKRMCMALGVKALDDTAHEIEKLFQLLTKPKENLLDKLSLLPKLNQFASWMPKVIAGRGACQQVVMPEADLYKLPVMQCWPRDGGPFLTLPVIHTKDPVTGIRNVGMYRMQVFSREMTGMHWHKHKVSARHFNEYKRLGKRMPVAVSLGGDPVYTYAATAPLPDNVDEYMLAGFLRKKKVEMVRCITQPEIEVPVDADFVIEGYVDPREEPIWEGPFGDHTGYYSLPDWYPRFHVTCITRRRNAVYPSTIVGIPPQEDAWIGKATERIFLAPIKMTLVPEIIDMEMPVEGVFHNLVIAKIKKEYAGQAQKVMNAMWGAGQMMFNKILVVVDQGADIHDYLELARHVFTHLRPASDIYFSQGPMDVLDHSCSKLGFGGKMCIDGTAKFEEEQLTSEPAAVDLPEIDVAALRAAYPEIAAVNADLLPLGIPCVFIAVEKNKKGHVRELSDALFGSPEISKIKVILFVEHTVDVSDIADTLWRFCNNLDPKRDHFISGDHIGFDGTRKTAEFDDFHRDWPNIIVSDAETISAVDKKWATLGLGPFIKSPSLKYRDQIYGEGASVG
ncbi:MAG TPA: menaquinone biosynthesis decarboxylase [Chitinophagaceae bacterium]|nr:menaquinone biosynthesis decarboxylase [Chitinophagaceae bacterium]